MTITLHTEADTQLRDAAPALAATLQNLVRVFESEYGKGASSPAIADARAALAKAGL